MTTNSNKDAGLEYVQMGREWVPLNDHAEPMDINKTTEGMPTTDVTATNDAPASLRGTTDDMDGTDGCDGAIEPDARPHNIVTIDGGQRTHCAARDSARKAISGGRTRSSNSGATGKRMYHPDLPVAQQKESDSERLIRLAERAFLFHNHDREAFATVEVDERIETWPIKGTDFKHWLTHRYFMDADNAPSTTGMKEAIAVLEAKAKFVGPTSRVFTRVAEHEGNIYLDLADEDRSIVEITPDGWRVVKKAPVKFRRAKAIRALPKPVSGGSVDELRPFVNFSDETDWMLIVAWLLAAFRPHGPYPLAALHGEHGSAKSTVSRVLRALVDPNTAPMRSEPRDVRDLMISASNGWIIGLDNLSRVPDWLSDLLCRLSTGGGFATRALHTDTDEVIIDAQRPVILNGIEELATRGDLLDRSLVITLPAIGSGQRKTERNFWKAFNEAQPRILGALLTIVAGAMRELPSVDLAHLPRLADFAVWVAAAEPALGWERGAFMDAFLENRRRANDVALDASLLATPILKLIETKPWSGTAEQLLCVLEPLVPESLRRNPEWPRTPRGLSGALRRLNPNLRPLGVQITFGRDNSRERTRVINIGRPAPSGSSAPSGSGATLPN